MRQKIRIFYQLELPLPIRSGIMKDNADADNTVPTNCTNVTTSCNMNYPINFSNIENCAENMVGRKGFEPSNPAMSRRYLNQARPPARSYACQVLQFCTINPLRVFIFAIIHVII
jgi:hypothetical protein